MNIYITVIWHGCIVIVYLGEREREWERGRQGEGGGRRGMRGEGRESRWGVGVSGGERGGGMGEGAGGAW